jgi:aldose 1-epimerase
MKTEFYGELPDGREVSRYTLTNRRGMMLRVINYGAIVTELHVPDRDGNLADVALGFDNLDQYRENKPYFGAIIGRVGNRIAHARFTLASQTYTLAQNNGRNHLHGGLQGFDKVLWHGEPVTRAGATGVKFTYRSVDGEENYPGILDCTVTYWLSDADNAFEIEYAAVTDKATPINLTNHSYFNLRGHNTGTNLDHELLLNASRFTPVDETLIPTGELRAVTGTPMDFTTSARIGARINADDEQLRFGGGYDHNWVLDKKNPGELSLAARVHEPESGRIMEVWTTEPGVQFYGGNFLDGSSVGKGGAAYHRRNGFCIETQHFPDAVNQQGRPGWPSVLLQPGETYTQRTIHWFSCARKPA